MRLCLYQGCPSCHYEMIGYWVDFARSQGHTFDVIASRSDAEGASWMEFYRHHFGAGAEYRDADPDRLAQHYDAIIILTDDDVSFRDEWKDRLRRKLVYIDHYKLVRRDPQAIHVSTRFFSACPRPHGWALPTYSVVGSADDKRAALAAAQGRPFIVGVGTSCVASPDHYRRLFGDAAFEACQFTFLGRHVSLGGMQAAFQGLANVAFHLDVDTLHMAEVMRRATHVVFTKEGDYVDCGMSGGVPLAFSFGAQMIMPESWNREYKFASALTYEPPGATHGAGAGGLARPPVPDLDMERYLGQDLDVVFAEREALVAHRNMVLSNALHAVAVAASAGQ